MIGKGDIDATYRKKGPTDVRARDGWYIGMVLYCINEAVNDSMSVTLPLGPHLLGFLPFFLWCAHVRVLVP